MSEQPPEYTQPIDAWRHWIEGMRERVIRTSRESEGEALFLILAQVIEEQQKWTQKIEDEERVNIFAIFERLEVLMKRLDILEKRLEDYDTQRLDKLAGKIWFLEQKLKNP